MKLLLSIANMIEAFILWVSSIMCWATALLMMVIIVNVTLRYGFNNGLIIFEEIQWHLYAIGIMFGLSHAEITNSHVRVDVVASRLNPRTVLKWEVFGCLIFVLPIVFVFVFNSIDYVANAYELGEKSSSPLGLPYRWAIKAVIPVSFILLGLASIARLIKNIHQLNDVGDTHGYK